MAGNNPLPLQNENEEKVSRKLGNYLNKNERKEGEGIPIDLILCSEGNTEHIEYLMLDEDSPIKVAQYYTQLPDKKLLSEKLQRAIAIAKGHYAEKAFGNL